MKVLSYRGRRRLKRIAITLGVIVVLAALGLVISFRYLERYMVYGADGAVMVLPWEEDQSLAEAPQEAEEYTLSQVPSTTVETLSPTGNPVTAAEPAEIDITPETAEDPAAQETRQGYYITLEDLSDPEAVLALLDSDPDCSTLVLEVKSTYGTAAYSSRVEGVSSSDSVDVSVVDALIADLADREGLHLAALLPAFCDSLYALAHQTEGLPISGGALWLDWDSCYWLDPASDLVRQHLLDLCQELTELGFDEIVFSDFTFPDSGNIVYAGDRSEALLQAAEDLVSQAQKMKIAVSFWDPDQSRPVLTPSEDGYLYIPATRGSETGQVLSWLEAADTDLSDRLIFCTASHDTRFEDYPVLRPLGFDE